MACTTQAVTPWVTDDPVVGGSLWSKSTALDFMVALARDFGKCQNHVPKALSDLHIPMVGSIPPTGVLITETHAKGSDPSG
jgi:hypothetical protein